MKSLLVLIVTGALAVGNAHADLVAFFDLGSSTPLSNPQSASQEAPGVNGSLGFAGTDAVANGYTGTGYTHPNVNGGSPVASGQALGWDSGVDAGDNLWGVDLNLTGWQDLELRYDYRSTSTGPLAARLYYDIGLGPVNFVNVNFNNDANFNDSGWFTLPAAVNNQSSVQVFMQDIADGSGSGTLRIDNVHLEGTVVPEPSTLALLGIALLGAAAARRRT